MMMKRYHRSAGRNERELKVIRQNGSGYKPTPTIMLKGQWLKKFGFDFDMPVKVTCRDGEIVITKAERKAYVSPMDILMPAVAEDEETYRES